MQQEEKNLLERNIKSLKDQNNNITNQYNLLRNESQTTINQLNDLKVKNNNLIKKQEEEESKKKEKKKILKIIKTLLI